MEVTKHFYKAPDGLETIAILEAPDGTISLGIARAGKADIEARRVSPEEGIRVAEGRARKAMRQKTTLLEKNYLRGMYAEEIVPVPDKTV